MEAARAYPPERAAEICGVQADDIRTLARWYNQASPAVIAWGNGLERNQNGGSGLRAIAALPALAGKFAVAGGGLVGGAGHAFPKTPDRLTRPDFVPPQTRTINILDVSKLLLDESLNPPLKALFVYNHNPLIVHPEQNRMKQALAQEDLFIVGIEVAMTDSMAYADVILPVLTSSMLTSTRLTASSICSAPRRSSRRSAKACRIPRFSAGSRPSSVSPIPHSRQATQN
jgi:anaerobic selenocysteine-containing dehydrogenase